WRLSTGVREETLPALQPLLASLAGLGVEVGDNRGFGGADISPMRQLGMPVFQPSQDARPYFDGHHTADDTLARADPEGLAQNVAVYASLAWAASELDLGLVPLDPADAGR